MKFSKEAIDKFWGRVNKNGPLLNKDLGRCWTFTDASGNECKSYAQFWCDGRVWRSNRISWAIENGNVPEGLCVMHKCDNSACVRPSHLEVGSWSQNAKDLTRMKIRGAFGKLNEDQVRRVRKWTPESGFLSSLAKEFGVTLASLIRIRSGDTYKWVED